MSELFIKIFEEVISKEVDAKKMDRRISEYIEEYISQYDSSLSENELERLRDCVYYASLMSEREAFYLGMKYTLKIVLSLMICL